MKRGCFIKLVFVGTILIAVVLYILQNKFDEFFSEPGKELVLSFIDDNWETELSYIKGNVEKDSLKVLLTFYIKGTESAGKLISEELIETMEKTFKDSLIDKVELENLTNLVKRLSNERSKKN